ncbi:MAG: D-alanyl-D-alanine carboxypeptidase [Treponema sp.]|nr:D-alanyl-D-alanine carboxypeptidase [Treponema sp.]MCL2252177.1 D-alanyl-D-alanine carboxypeptidase [Treponema sp.]
MKKIFLICLFFFSAFFLFSQYFHTPSLLTPYYEAALETLELDSRSVVLIDASTATLLFAKNADEEIPPASLTKLMTMNIAMNEVKAGRASYDEVVKLTEDSWSLRQPPRSSLMFLEPEQTVTLREVLLGLAVPSGNDAAVAIALRFAPSMNDFAQMMTKEARNMGLKVTRFVESSGYSEQNIITANEFAFFCYQYVRLHPDSMKDFHSVKEFSYPLGKNESGRFRNYPRTITQVNRNNLLYNYEGVDGLKTGYINESGYNLALTAIQNQNRFIAVILGASSERTRQDDGRILLNWAFENFKTVRPLISHIEQARLWKGKENNVQLKLAGEADFTSPLNRSNNLFFHNEINDPLIAPLSENHQVGFLVISDEEGEVSRVPLLTVKNYEKGNFFKRIWHSILLLFKR